MNILVSKRTKDFFWRCIQIAFKDGVSFFFLLFSASYLTGWEFGVYNLAIAAAFTIAIFSDFGISTATSKFVAEEIALKSGNELKIFSNALLVILALSIVIVIIFITLYSFINHDSFTYLMYVMPLVLLAPVAALFDGFYRGKRQFEKLSKITILSGILSIIIGSILIMNFGLVGSILAQCSLYFFFLIGCILNIEKIPLSLNKKIIHQITSYSILIGLANVSFFLFSKINVFIIGYFGYIVEAGYYEFANKVILMIMLPYMILSQVISPEVTALHTKKESKKLLKFYDKLIIICVLTSSSLVFVFYVLSPYIVNSYNYPLFNNETIAIFKLLLIAFVSQSMSTVAAVGFSTASGDAKLNLWFLLIFGILNTLLALYLVPIIGFMGAVYTNVFIKVISDLLFLQIYRNRIKKQYD